MEIDMNVTNPRIVRDSIGEKTDLTLCPRCTALPDCFANIGGKCVALNRTYASGGCAFYKTRAQFNEDARKCYESLMRKGRMDLIHKYKKPLTYMGVMDEDIASAEEYGAEFEKFRESDFAEQMNSVRRPAFSILDLLDEEEGEEDG